MITPRTTTQDIECVLLARCGFSYKLISQRTGLSKGQIALRLKQTGSQVGKYRDGTTVLSQRIIENVHTDITQQLRSIRENLVKQLQNK